MTVKENYLIEIENLRVSYEGSRQAVIKGADLRLAAGSLTALLGVNGSGKTTLLKAVCGLLPSEADRKEVCGRDMHNMSKKELSSAISYIPQKHGIIYHIEALEVALMGINPYLKAFQIPTKLHRELAREMLMHVGLQTEWDRDFQSLSEGQKQLVILARALVQNATVMMFDEPDSALDYGNKRRILQKISGIIRENGYAGLMTLHDPDYALRYCDKILLLQNGTIQDTIDCRTTNREEAEQKLQILYPELTLAVWEDGFLTVK